jgi:nucleotide-binding universal stress UspA family protein
VTRSGHRILIAVDGSPASLRAASLAIDLAVAWHADVRAIAVLGEEAADRFLEPSRPHERSAMERRRNGLEYALEHLSRSGAGKGIKVQSVLRVRKDAPPYEVILEEAATWKADLLFVGRTSHRGLGRALLGSQTEHILEFAHTPVVVVPAESS